MEPAEVLEIFDATAWSGPFDAREQARAVDALELGRVVFFPRLAFVVRPDEAEFLTSATGAENRKNISLDPRTGRVHGTSVEGDRQARLAAMIDRFGRQADGLVRALFPGYAPTLERARTSFRPAEISGRATTPRHDDKLMHVDAFPTRPLRGRRIFRVFANIAPDGVSRSWRVGEPFPEFARKFFPGLRGPLPGQNVVMEKLGLTKGRRSAYDHYMLRLHDAGKLDAAYQASAPQASVGFPPGTAWMCFTDSVLHAAMSGHFALEQTFHLPVDGMADPSRSPLRVLERLAGRALAD
jgi:hypothetical protein